MEAGHKLVEGCHKLEEGLSQACLILVKSFIKGFHKLIEGM